MVERLGCILSASEDFSMQNKQLEPHPTDFLAYRAATGTPALPAICPRQHPYRPIGNRSMKGYRTRFRAALEIRLVAAA
jgi:hypothetical protein